MDSKDFKKNIFIENTVKNIFIVLLLVLSFGFFRTYLLSVNPIGGGYDSILLVSSIFIVSFLFADYGFTYKDSHMTNEIQRLLSHSITTLIMYGTGALLEISSITINLKIGKPFLPFELLMVLFYISLVMYDYWDLNRAFLKKSR